MQPFGSVGARPGGYLEEVLLGIEVAWRARPSLHMVSLKSIPTSAWGSSHLSWMVPCRAFLIQTVGPAWRGQARSLVSQQMKCTAVRGEARSSPASQNIIDKLLGSCPSRQRSAEQRCCVAGGFSGPTQGIGRRAARVAAVKASSAVCRSTGIRSPIPAHL